MGLLDGKVALITGGARGQGRAHAQTCAREGADVIVFDIAAPLATLAYPLASSDDLDETVSLVEGFDRRALVVKGDVRSQADLDGAVSLGIAEFGHIDILIANAGIWSRAPFWELTDEQWGETVDTNLSGVWRSAKAVAPHLIEQESGSIVITTSANALEPVENYAHYVAAKHGLIGLMKAIALELAPYGVRCNAIVPGAINTPMVNNSTNWDLFAGHEGATEEEALKSGYHYHALKGAGFLHPQVIADSALYLNSDLAAYVTGATLTVDAGHSLLNGVNPNPKY